MLRNLRSRRRPRFGAHICAIIAALLLLLSVSLLHSRLGFDRQSHVHPFSSSRLEFPEDSSDDADAIVANPLLVDAESDGSGNNDEDRIDELDVIEEENDDQSRVSNEEEILRRFELENDSESDVQDENRNRRSGYFWDHVIGVRRRAFDKFSIDQWDDYSSSDSSLNVEDRSKIAFGSDDQPVDEDVRRKLDEIKGIEDALLLKTSDGVSPLREGWATWFETKSVFLRRDRMFKSNLELLNPLTNLLLQDPDGVGTTTLTRGDKLVQKALWSELRKLPFGVKGPLGVTVKPHEPELGGDGNDVIAIKKIEVKKSMRDTERTSTEVKRMDRRTLDDAVGHSTNGKNIAVPSLPLNSSKMVDAADGNFSIGAVKGEGASPYKHIGREPLLLNDVNGTNKVSDLSMGKLDQKSGSKNLDSDDRIKSVVSGHMYADGKRWGYFPGLYSHLSFSDFMDEFFRQSRCLMRVFMIWNSPPWMYTVRHQRGLESLLYHNPDVCVVVFSETVELDFFKDFVKDGFKVAVAMPNLDELLKNTPVHVFASVWFEWRKTKFYSIHYSELLRLAALYKYGGLYLDSDVIVLKPLLSLDNSVGMEDQLAESSFSGAVMAFNKHSPFILECLTEFYSTYDDTRLKWNGAELLTRVARNFLSKENTYDNQLELKTLSSSMFFPINRREITRYFTVPEDTNERAQQDILFRRILNESFTFHFWNSITYSLIPEPESLVARLLNHYCLRCFDVL